MSTHSGYDAVEQKGGSIQDVEEGSKSKSFSPFQVLMLLPIFNPSSFLFRYTILVFACLLTFGSYFCYDNPGAMQDGFESTFGINSFEYESLYSVYSWPNTVQVFFGGWLIDRFFGLRLGAMVFCSLVLVGQCIFSAGTTIGGMGGYVVALIGRFVFGLGGESLAVAQSTYSAKWFKGNELAMAFGITLSFSRIGSAVNFNVEPNIESATNISVAVWFGAGLCALSALAALILAFFDRRGERAKELLGENKGEEEVVQAEEPVRLTDVMFFPISMWFIYCICVTFYVAVFIFITIAANYFQDKFGYSTSIAARIVSIPYLVSAVCSPFLGFMVDKIGFSIFWIMFSCLSLCVIHVSIAIFSFTPIPAMILMGVVYSLLAASLWPCVALIIDLSRLGTAYGLMTALQNLGLAVTPLVIGQIVDQFGDKAAIYIFAGCALCAFLLSCCLLVTDFLAGRPINASASTIRKRLEEVEKAAEEHIEFGEELVETSTEMLLKPRSHKTIRHTYLYKVGVGGHRPDTMFT